MLVIPLVSFVSISFLTVDYDKKRATNIGFLLSAQILVAPNYNKVELPEINMHVQTIRGEPTVCLLPYLRPE